MRPLTPAFVVTVATACSAPTTTNPPPLETGTNTASASATAGEKVAGTATASASPSATAASAIASVDAKPKRKRVGKDAISKEWKPAKSTGPYEYLHPADAEGRTILVGDDNSCYVETPLPEDIGVPRPTGAPPPMKRTLVDCPELFDDPAWDDHRNGWTLARETQSKKCVFLPQGGNPPPPPLEATCPRPAKQKP